MEIKNRCGSCKNFVKHYVVINANFAPINWGHCTENYRYNKILSIDKAGCEKWELCESVFKRNDIEYYVSNFLVNAAKIAEVLEVLYKRK